MKKRRPPRPRNRKARPASTGVEAKRKVGDLSSTVGTGPIASPRPPNAVLERATGRFGAPARTGKEGMQADWTVSRPATVFSDDECARLDDICGVYCLMAATCDRGSHICKILDITKRDSCAGLGQSSALSKAQASGPRKGR
jgi:hypothetical protein